MAPEPKLWGAADLRRRCRQLREQLAVAASDVVTAEELAAYWPGGGENQNHGPRGQWIFCYAQLIRLCDRMRDVPTAREVVEAEQARSDALTDKPVPVKLNDGTTIHVQPLSYVALEFLTTLDRTVTLAQELAASVALQQSPESESALALEPMLRSYAVQLWAWTLTSESGEIPFDPISEDPVPPEWTRRMTPQDLLAIYAAHREVNATRNALVASLFPSEQQSKVKLSLAGFIGAYAHEKGVDAGRLMKSFRVGKIFAQAVSAAQQHEAAAAAAKKKRPEAA